MVEVIAPLPTRLSFPCKCITHAGSGDVFIEILHAAAASDLVAEGDWLGLLSLSLPFQIELLFYLLNVVVAEDAIVDIN